MELSTDPDSIVITNEPPVVRVIFSSKDISTAIISPMMYIPLSVDDVMPVTVAAMVSTVMVVVLAVPVILFPARSVMIELNVITPPLSKPVNSSMSVLPDADLSIRTSSVPLVTSEDCIVSAAPTFT